MPYRILIVDDDAAVRSAIAQMLLEGGYDLEEADGGNQALEAMRERVPDLVLLDMMMPDVTGWDVLARMTANPALAAVPVVVLTALGQPLDLPSDRTVLHKPMEKEVLLSVVRKALRT